MKKINFLILSFTLLIFTSGCAGYKPIFSSKNVQYKINDHSIEGDKILGQNIYSKLYNAFQSNKNDQTLRSVSIFIKSSKNKSATSKDSDGKILEYRVTLNTEIHVKDYITDDEILNQTLVYSSTYKVQDQYSNTIKLENQSTQNLINKTYQDILIILSQNITKK